MKKYRQLDNYLWTTYNRCNKYRKKADPKYNKNAHFMMPFREWLPGMERYCEAAGLPTLAQKKEKDPENKLFSFGFTDEEIMERIVYIWEEWLLSHSGSIQLRHGTTKDNDGKYVGSGNGRNSPYYRGNRVRVPSKKRKNKMKQFKKLFPDYIKT